VPVNFLTYLHRFRRISVAVAVGLVMLQTALAGLATAHAAALAANPFAGAICHGSGNGNADPLDGTAPDKDVAALCCAFCTAIAAALTSDNVPVAGFFRISADAAAPIAHQTVMPRDARAVRAGPSQAPPVRA
jgi:hypothetical protein